MDEVDAITLLLKASRLDPLPEHLEVSKKIVTELYCIPLAIDHAGAYIEAGKCDIDQYLYNTIQNNHFYRSMVYIHITLICQMMLCLIRTLSNWLIHFSNKSRNNSVLIYSNNSRRINIRKCVYCTFISWLSAFITCMLISCSNNSIFTQYIKCLI